ncbi:diaminobutyrate acetyltransferase [Salinihabitans flavidus]|uniref:L-2,4-diaminobutyric acid acetyltransferase n=1 Tax=Salinihabitans flavidus TaxID=569882 RepID=A0A1H8TM07_9RHOB|nr:diaminobutyrate acetyltransferase [Salinihabitans flavidus]SEO91846.1 diaminobutyrate acetyltransferase [Salinihabitans flavidus]
MKLAIHNPLDRTTVLRKPTAEDGADIWDLIQACKPLDENSMYCNLLQADHFRDTCVIAERDGKILGWISAYLVPDDAEKVFVWQVAVSEQARGLGLGSRMLQHLLERTECKDVKSLQTTITLDNEASWALFRRFADKNDGELTHEPHFKRNDHFGGQHATEHMVTISLREEKMRKAA